MSSTWLRKLWPLLLLTAAFGQNSINIDTQVKGSRWPAFGVDSGAANAYAVTTFAPLGPSLRTGSQIVFYAAHANTSASTLAVDGGSPIAIKKTVTTALATGDILLNGLVIVWYDGTNFQCATCGTGGSASYVLQINGTGLTAADTVNFNDTTPVAGANGLNIKWQKSTVSTTDSVSAYVPGDGNAAHVLLGTGVFGAVPSAVIDYRTCALSFGASNGPALLNADLNPQVSNRCYLAFGATVVEIMVTADAGTPNILVAKNHLGVQTNLISGALATASSGGRACSNAGGTVSLDGSTTCTNTLTVTSASAGDFIEPSGGTAGGTAAAFNVSVVWSVTGTTLHTCMMSFGANNGSALANADLSPQLANRCYLPAGSTIVEVMVTADAGTPSFQIAKNHLTAQTNLLTGALATASSGGRACSNAGGTTSLDGSTSCTNTLTVTSITAGDFLEPNGGTAGGTAKAFSAAISYTTP